MLKQRPSLQSSSSKSGSHSLHLVQRGNDGGSNFEEACTGDVVGDSGDGGGGGEDRPSVMLRAVSSPAPRSFSGVDSLEADSREAAVPLLQARAAALWLTHEAVSAALAFFTASSRALKTWARTVDEADDGGRVGSISLGEGTINEEGEVTFCAAGRLISSPVATPAVGMSG